MLIKKTPGGFFSGQIFGVFHIDNPVIFEHRQFYFFLPNLHNSVYLWLSFVAHIIFLSDKADLDHPRWGALIGDCQC